MKSQPVLSDSETFSEVDGDTQPLNIIKKNNNKQWSKSTKESSLREKKYSSNE